MMQIHHGSLGDGMVGGGHGFLGGERGLMSGCVYAPGIPVASGMDFLFLFAVSAPAHLSL